MAVIHRAHTDSAQEKATGERRAGLRGAPCSLHSEDLTSASEEEAKPTNAPGEGRHSSYGTEGSSLVGQKLTRT